MGNVNVLTQIPIEYISIYLVAIIFVGLVGVILIEWFDKRLVKLISPVCERITDRRAAVIARDKKLKLK